MKRKISLFVAAALATIIGLSSCSKDENQAPKINGAVLSSDNKTITVTFSEGVYKNADKTGNLDASSLTVTAPAEIEFTYTVDHTAGSASAVINLVITSVVQGTEKFTVKPASASAIYDNEGEPMEAGTTIETNVASKDLGIMGKWLSEGANVAPLLVTYFNVLKVEAEFKTDYTYKVNQFNVGNTTTTPDLIFTGTYVIEKSTTGNIWTITCNQELPYAAAASGIFEVKTNPEVMWYEVVQTTGTQNVPPTPQAGFGSSNGGSLGTINIQKFVRVQ
jgi:lipopolysaccharide export system protein LptA